MNLLAHTVAQAMADYENEHRYELENGYQSTGVEPYEAGAEDFEKIAAFVAQRLQGAVEEAEKWKRIAQDRCTCVKTCGDTPEDSGGICKELPRDRGQ